MDADNCVYHEELKALVAQEALRSLSPREKAKLEKLKQHCELCAHQRDQFNTQKKALQPGQVIVVLDFGKHVCTPMRGAKTRGRVTDLVVGVI